MGVALDEIKRGRSVTYDTDVVDACLDAVELDIEG